MTKKAGAIKQLEERAAVLESALEQVRQEITRELENQTELLINLRAYDGVIGLQGIEFGPNDYYKPVAPNQPRMFGEHGGLLGRALEALHIARAPLSTLEVAE